MSPVEASFIMFAGMMVLILTGIPLVFALGGASVALGYFLVGPQMLSIAYSSAFGVLGEFVLLAVPLFIFMGAMLQVSGVADALYAAIYTWSGGLRGGLAIGTVGISTLMAAMTGISGAACVSMGLIALPSMLKRGYDKHIAMGSIMAGAALGELIPPSVIFILWGLFADVSIGKLFAGGLFPGLVLSGIFMLYIGIRAYLQPELCPSIPRSERLTGKEKIASLRNLILPIVLMLVVLVAIFSGAATPTEAAAVGAFGSIFCSWFARTLSWKVVKDAARNSVLISGMAGWIIIGAYSFTAVYSATGGPGVVQNFVSSSGLDRWVIFALMQLSFFILGCLLDPSAIIMITVPIYLPLVKMLGFDPVWYGVVFCVNMEMAYLTPPFGFNLFYMKGVVPPGITMADIYRSVPPFVVLQAIGLIITIVFPQLALWLPNKLFR